MFNYLAHLTYPRFSNNFKARLLHTEVILVLALAILGFNFFLKHTLSFQSQVLGYAAEIDPTEVVRLTNIKRMEAGVNKLTIDPSLTEAAKEKGQDMLKYDYWAHISPTGTEPWSFFAKVGYKYRYAGENLARDFASPQAVVDAWMASPSHKDNLLSDHYSDIGVAVVEGNLAGADTTLVVQLFGRRAGQESALVPVASAQDNTKASETNVQANTTTNTPETNIQKAPEQIKPLDVNKAVTIGLLTILALVLVVDVIEVRRKKITRTGSRSFAHISFLLMIIIIIFIVRSGQIL